MQTDEVNRVAASSFYFPTQAWKAPQLNSSLANCQLAKFFAKTKTLKESRMASGSFSVIRY